MLIIIGILVGTLVTSVAAILFYKNANENILHHKQVADTILKSTEKEAEDIKKAKIFDTKEEVLKLKNENERQFEKRNNELQKRENEYNARLTKLDKRLDNLENKEDSLKQSKQALADKKEQLLIKQQEIKEITEKQERKLEEISAMTRDEVIELLKNQLIDEAKKLSTKKIKLIKEETEKNSVKLSSSILATAIQRIAVDYVSETTVSVVSLPSDDMKGRIIGREGRNIRSFEQITGIDLIIDDTPEAVVLSGYHPIRREIARVTLETLVEDGRIHPGRIESVYNKVKSEMDTRLTKIGEETCLDMNIHNISPNLIPIIGKLQFRTSYGQNILKHSLETAWISQIIAAELGLDKKIAKRAGFLHDIGKAIDHEIEGTHAAIGANLARKNGESKIIINAIEAHHEDIPAESVYAEIVKIADSVSGARPGARREVLESYMERLHKLEEIATSIDGVYKSYAIQAGREIRIIVDPSKVNDERTQFIATDVAKTVEEQIQYPGQIKITVLRETRKSAIAK